jgi:tRNA-Thr(GGU) m(6)t(6)A37 methyltransferase TsaA
MEAISITPIGVIRSPFKTPEGMPIQPAGARGEKGEVHLDEKYLEGLKDLDGFSHVIMIYHFHKSSGCDLTVKPFMDETPRGLFATRAPRRPNPIGLSVVRVTGVEGNVVKIEDVDVLDGTPLLDIKPYVPRFDAPAAERCGWLDDKAEKADGMRSDDRFSGGG